MTETQEDILRYLITQFKLCYYDLNEADKVKVMDQHGASMTFTSNEFGDILDADTEQIVAISDIPHDIDKIGSRRPTKWENSIGYFG